MARWDEKYSTDPNQNTSPVPDGAPEGHAPSGTNNWGRQTMAAIADIGARIMGASADTGDETNEPTTLSDEFEQLIFDRLYPVGRVVHWDSRGGTVPIDDATGGLIPQGVAAVFTACDGRNVAGYGDVPDYVDRAVYGANPDPQDASPQTFTGEKLAADQTSSDATGLSVDDHDKLVESNLPGLNLDHGHTASTNAVRVSGNAGTAFGLGQTQTAGATVTVNSATLRINNAALSDPNAQTQLTHSVTDGGHAHTAAAPDRTRLEVYVRTS